MRGEQSRIVRCRPNQLAVGIDPGASTGGVAVVATDDLGAPRLVSAASWIRRRRKAGDVYAVQSVTSSGYECAYYVDALARLLPENCSAVALEGLFMPRGPSKGMLALAEAAGAAQAAVWLRYGVMPLRPRYYEWASSVADVSRGMRAKACAAELRRSWLDEHGATAWRLRLDKHADPTEHAVDAIGLALYAAGGAVDAP